MKDSTVRRLSTLHTWLFRITSGRVGRRLVDNDMLLLTTTGLETSRPHTVPLLYLRFGEEYVVMASYGGRPDHPQWYRNLMGKPGATIRIGNTKVSVAARTTSGEERERLWERVTDAYAGYEIYQSRTERQIPVVVLSPLSR